MQHVGIKVTTTCEITKITDLAAVSESVIDGGLRRVQTVRDAGMERMRILPLVLLGLLRPSMATVFPLTQVGGLHPREQTPA